MEESGFMTEPGISGTVSRLERIYSSDTGFSEIWRADKYGHFVVLKCLKEEYRGLPVYESLLRKEFDTSYGLNHPSICRVWNYSKHPSLGHCIEMEWVDGMNLYDFLKQGKPSEKLFRKIATELCEALSYIHSRQVIHRDISPGNIMITHSGKNVKLIDFGLADSDSSTILKMQAGTRQFMAPEVRDGGVADIRSDIYSAGKVLSSLTSGHRRVLRKACSINPVQRFQSALEFKQDLMKKGSAAPFLLIPTLLALLAAGFAMYTKQDSPAPSESSSAIEGTQLPGNTQSTQIEPKERPQIKSKEDTKQSATREELDALLNQAEDLFR